MSDFTAVRRNAIRASRPVAAAADDLADFLSDLSNHWALCRDFVEVTPVAPDGAGKGGAIVSLSGPLGIRRRARTRLLGAGLFEVSGRASLDSGSTARISWRLVPARGTTTVVLEVELQSSTLLDRILFSLGRAWLAARLADALEELGKIAVTAAERTRSQPIPAAGAHR